MIINRLHTKANIAACLDCRIEVIHAIDAAE
jgi:hypothetical protein